MFFTPEPYAQAEVNFVRDRAMRGVAGARWLRQLPRATRPQRHHRRISLHHRPVLDR